MLLTLVGCQEYGLYRPLSAQPGDWTATESVPRDIAVPEAVHQSWSLEGTQVDLLFFGDTSGSMVPELQTMGAQAEAFVDTLEFYAIDWQLLAVTGPDGCGNNGVISSEDADFASLFSQGLTTAPGEDRVDEWGLHNALEAVRQSEPGRCNAGFLRHDANLHVVFISDEDDNSPGWTDGGDYWRDYTDEIRWHYFGGMSVIFSSITGPDPGGCSGAEPGVGYWQAAAEAEGAQIPICGDWSSELELLARISAMRVFFPLDEAPMLNTIGVWVDGEDRTGDWVYEASSHGIRFVQNAPIGGQQVEIDYLVRAEPSVFD